jgi:general secretion pathway protein A
VQRLNGRAETAFITNSTLPFDELLEYALADFGVDDPHGTRAQRLMALNRFLIGQRREGRKTVFIIDEAQNLNVATLEEIRLLSNFENSSGKLLQIILAGQPELHSKLTLPELRQLKQRIGLRCRLQPLAEEEIEQYIMSHWRVAGGRSRHPFTSAAIRRIAHYSGGIPRVVNMLCDHCLVMGYANQVREIDSDTVRRAIQYLEDGGSRDGWTRRLGQGRPTLARVSRHAIMWSAGAMAAVAATAAVMAPSAYRPVVNAVLTGAVSVVGGLVRWLTQWWG